MQGNERQHFKESTTSTAERKEEPVKKSETAAESTRPKPGSRARLLRRSTSQCLLLNENQNDLNVKSKQDSTISSGSSGLLFTRPLSSFPKQQPKPVAFVRPKTSRASALGTRGKISEERSRKQAKSKPCWPTRTSVLSLRRQSNYFSFQSIQRSLSADGSSRRFITKKRSRGAEKDRGGFMGLVTSIDEREERRQLVMCYAICRPQPAFHYQMGKHVHLLKISLYALLLEKTFHGINANSKKSVNVQLCSHFPRALTSLTLIELRWNVHFHDLDFYQFLCQLLGYAGSSNIQHQLEAITIISIWIVTLLYNTFRFFPQTQTFTVTPTLHNIISWVLQEMNYPVYKIGSF